MTLVDKAVEIYKGVHHEGRPSAWVTEKLHEVAREFHAFNDAVIPMLLWCPGCGTRHIDRGRFEKHPHHTHACQNCGVVWRPAILNTVGVDFLPGFKDEP